VASRPRQWFDFALLYLVFQAARPLPRSWLLAVGRGLGTLVWRVIRFRREVVLDNLRHAFGTERDEAALHTLAHAFYRNLGMTFMEFLILPRLDRERVADLVEIEGREHLEAVLAGGRGGLLVSGHFGNWEYLGARIAALDVPVNFIVKTQHNPRVDRVQNDIRRRAGVGVIRAGAPIKEMFRALRRQEFIAMLADQDAGPDGVFTEFLGRPAAVFRGAAYLAWKLDIPLVTGFIFRRPGGGHLAVIDPPVEADRSLPEDEAVQRLTEHHVRRLEAAVRRAPDHYYWVHRRWKTRPPPSDAAG
jgi:KDO2-lipid IV(A) lauroyltransferase